MSTLGNRAAIEPVYRQQGAGRLYYRIGMQYAPKNLKLDPPIMDSPFAHYEPVDNADDVKQNADGLDDQVRRRVASA